MTVLAPELLPSNQYTFQSLRYLLQQQPIQPGVVGTTDFQVVQRGAGANQSVDVGLGGAWVLGQGVTRQGLYHCLNDAAVNAVVTAANGSNPRIDQVLLVVDDASVSGVANQARLVVDAGVATVGATLDNRTGATADATLTSTYKSWLRLADLLIPTSSTSVVTANIRDRRPWARGAYNRIARTSGDISITATTYGEIDSVNLRPRIECSGAPLKLSLRPAVFFATASGHAYFVPLLDGGAMDSMATIGTTVTTGNALGAVRGDVSSVIQTAGLDYVTLPVAGSHLFSWAWGLGAANSTTIRSTAAQPLVLTVEEIVRQNANNGLS